MQQERRETPDGTAPAPTSGAGTVLAPFRMPAFRSQWLGDLMAAIATEMEMVILGWYVFNETGSVLLLTLFGALHFFGTVSAPLIGAIGDRIGLRRLITLMRTHYVALTAIQATFALTGNMSPATVFVLSMVMALVRPSDISVRTALVAELMPPALLTGAVGISRSTGDVARIFGALAGATLFALFGIGFAYLAVVGLYVGGLLLTIVAGRIAGAPRRTYQGTRPSHWSELAAGLAYVWRSPQLNGAMWLAVLVNLTAFPLSGGLMPYIAKNVHGLDKTGLGFLIASFATGALIGSLSVGAVGSRLALGRTMLIASAIWHLFLLVFVHMPGAVSAAAFLVLAGCAQSVSMVTLAALLLRTSAPEYRGRIMGVRMLSTYSLPVGLIGLGWLIERIGFPVTASLSAVLGVVLTLAIAIYWRAALWRGEAPANAV